MILDGFIFYNEFELLEMRLQELKGVVDKHILVECNRTHSGTLKPYYFEAQMERYEKYLDRIIHVKTTSPANDYILDLDHREKAQWREHKQRNAIAEGLKGYDADDWLIVSDVDEIPRPETVLWVSSRMDGKPVTFVQELYYYYLNCHQPQPWYGSVMYKINQQTTCQKIAGNRGKWPGIRQAGWHFSFLGGVERIMDKIAAYSETQTCNQYTSNGEFIRACLATGADIFGRDEEEFAKEFQTIDKTWPSCIQQILKQYPHLVRDA